MEASGLTTKMIHDNSIHDSIAFYLHLGETKEAFLKQFGNNLDKTIQFLRERSYGELEKPKPAPIAQVRKVVKEPEDNIMHPKHDFVPTVIPDKSVSKVKAKKSATKPNQVQQDLF